MTRKTRKESNMIFTVKETQEYVVEAASVSEVMNTLYASNIPAKRTREIHHIGAEVKVEGLSYVMYDKWVTDSTRGLRNE